MVLPIGGFMPIPLAMMIPFMATQSMVMGQAFGMSFQYGKRKISAMSNEEFNATKLQDLATDMYATYKLIIPNLKQSINDSQDLQRYIVASLLDMPRDLLSAFFEGLTGSTTAPTGTEGGEVAVGKETAEESFLPPSETTTTKTSAELKEDEILKLIPLMNLYLERVIAEQKSGGDAQSQILAYSALQKQMYQLQKEYQDLTGKWYDVAGAGLK